LDEQRSFLLSISNGRTFAPARQTTKRTLAENNSSSEPTTTPRLVGDLKNNPHNARTHSPQQIRQIAKSIREFGFNNPVLIDGNDMIISGHGRVDAAKLLGLSEVPTIRLEHLSPEQVRAYVIADNRLAELAGWDHDILAIELQHLQTIDSDFDVTITGFEVPEIDLILSGADDKPDPDDSFQVAETAQPVTQMGDLWLLGKHRLLCGSALEPQSYSTLMGSRRAAVVFVDCPYNVPYQWPCFWKWGDSIASFRWRRGR
jgi:hypothetical protein